MSVCFIIQDETWVPKLKILSRADSGQYHEENPGQYNEKNPGQYEETDEGQYYEINPGQVNNHHIKVAKIMAAWQPGCEKMDKEW